jgi:MFS family permease
LLAVAFFTTELTLAPVMGALSDRWGRRNFLIIGPFFGLLSVGLLLFTPVERPLPYLLCVQVLSGLCSAILVPASLSYLADFTSQNQALRVRIMSFYELATSGGIAVGVVVGGFIWDHLGRFAFALLGMSYLLVAGCMMLAPRVKQVIDRVPLSLMAARYWRIIRTPRLFIFIPAWICVSALVGIWFSSKVPFLLAMPSHDHHQHLLGSSHGPGGGSRMSLILGGFVLFFGLCLLFWAFFLSHVPRLGMMLTSVAGIYLACIALTGINHRGIENPLSLVLWVPLLLVGAFAVTSFAPSALAYLADISEEAARDRGLLMGLYSIFLGLGQLLGNGLGGFFAHRWGFDGLIYLTVLLATVALISLLSLYWQERKIAA